MSRNLNTATLDMAAKDWAGHLLLPNQFSKTHPDVAIGGREWVLQNFYNIHYKDEFAYLMTAIKGHMGPATIADFDKEAAERFTPRDDAIFAGLLAEKLAITPDGDHIPGKIGTCKHDSRAVGTRVTRFGNKRADWPIYAGEEEERALGNVRAVGEDGPGCDPIPPADTMWWNETDHLGQPSVMMALDTNVSIAAAQAALDALTPLLDGGSVAGMIEGRDGAQPNDPDAAAVGNVNFALVLTDPAFPSATDAAPGALATASAIADDTSADFTSTLTYCRASSSNVLETPLLDIIDGEAGTSGADFNFNTVAIVSGATISITDWTITLPQGPSAS